MFCFVLFCFVLFCFVLFCFVLFCFVLFDLPSVRSVCFFFVSVYSMVRCSLVRLLVGSLVGIVRLFVGSLVGFVCLLVRLSSFVVSFRMFRFSRLFLFVTFCTF